MHKKRRLGRMSIGQEKRIDAFGKVAFLVAAMLLLTPPTAYSADTDRLGVAVVSKTCGNAEMSLRCPAISGGRLDCLHPSLTLKDESGRSKKMAVPAGMEKYSPVGLACSASSKDGHSYFVVQYGELPRGCEFCEWFHIYETDGKLLTSSNPPIKRIEGMDAPRDQAPNNDEFNALSSKLDFGKFEEDYLRCEGETIDAKGNPICLKVNGEQDAKRTTNKTPPSEDAARHAIEGQEKLSVPGMSDTVLRAGMDYADFRRAILSKGWVPVVDKQCKSNVDGDNGLCEQMPELSGCSVDGYCLMHFHFLRTDQIMEVGAYGDTTSWSTKAKDSQLAVTAVTILNKGDH